MIHLDYLQITPINITFNCPGGATPGGEIGQALRKVFETTFKRIDDSLTKKGEQAPPYFRSELNEATTNEMPVLKDFGTPPRGYSLSLQQAASNTLVVSVNLFGRYARVLPSLIPRIPSLAKQWPGLGFEFVSITDVNNQPFESYTELASRQNATIETQILERARPTSNSLTLHFLSPTMLFNNHNSFGNLRLADLLRSLNRRANLISYLYCNGPQPSGEFDCPEAENVNIASSNLEWYFSEARGKESNIMGYVGRVKYVAKPSLLAELLPMLLLGQWLHVGQKTNYGAGQYLVDHECYQFAQ